jgi:hypothetical protein
VTDRPPAARSAYFMDKLGNKTGGRTKGTPNKSGRELKAFLGRVFARAFAERVTVIRTDPVTRDLVPVEIGFEDVLVEQILSMTIEPALLKTLLAYYAGQPPKSVDHNHKGTVNLAQLIAGTAPTEDAGDDDDDVEDDQ